MAQKTITVHNQAGIHCRPSSEILKAAEEYPDVELKVTSSRGDAELNSILALLALGLQCGDSVTIHASGPNEEAVCDKIAGMFAYEFDFPPR